MTRKRNPTSDMKRYKIIWEIDVYSDCMIDAAAEARRIQRDNCSTATVFGVMDSKTGVKYTVDLMDETSSEPSTKTIGYEVFFKKDKD